MNSKLNFETKKDFRLQNFRNFLILKKKEKKNCRKISYLWRKSFLYLFFEYYFSLTSTHKFNLYLNLFDLIETLHSESLSILKHIFFLKSKRKTFLNFFFLYFHSILSTHLFTFFLKQLPIQLTL